MKMEGVFLKSLASKVKEIRLQRNWTQVELAERAGIALPTYRLFERNGDISLRKLYRLSVALQCSREMDALFAPDPIPSIEAMMEPRKRERARGSR